MVLFGGRNWLGERAIEVFNFNDFADENSIILLSPSFKDREYWSPEKWSGKVLKSAVEFVEKKYNINSQKLLFYGYSAGGQCANLFYNYMPSEVEAWGAHACGVYPINPLKNGACAFITCGLDDAERVRISKNFIYKYRECGGRLIWKTYSAGHELNGGALAFARRFFSDILQKRSPVCIGEDETMRTVSLKNFSEIDTEFRNYLTSDELKKLWEAP